MPTIDFYYMPESPPCRAVEMVANMIGVKMNKHYINLAKGDHLKDDYLKLNPLHKVPFIVDGDLKLSESCAIMTYLINKYGSDDEYLYPTDLAERARVDELLFFGVGTLSESAAKLLRPILFGTAKELNPENEDAYKKVLQYLDKKLGDNGAKRFMVGNHLSVADIYFAAAFTFPEGCGYDLQKYSHLVSYLERMKAAIPDYSEINDEPIENMKMFVKSNQDGKV